MTKPMRSMIFSALAVAVSGLAADAALADGAACGQQAGSSAGLHETDTTEATGGAGGMLALVADALDDVQLTAEQRPAVDALLKEAITRHQPIIAEMANLEEELAKEIQQGRIDRAAMLPHVDKLADLWACTRDADLAALETLHGVLDEQQRGRFVDSLEKRFEAAGKAHEKAAWVDSMSDKLGLTKDQALRIKGAVCVQRQASESRIERARDRLHRVLEAFRGGTFLAADFPPETDPRTDVSNMFSAMFDLADQVLSTLNADQRTKLATIVEAHADRAREVAHAAPSAPSGKQPGAVTPTVVTPKKPSAAAPKEGGEPVGTSTQEQVVYGYGYPGAYYGSGYGAGTGSYSSYTYGSQSGYSSYYSSGYPFGWSWGVGGWGW